MKHEVIIRLGPGDGSEADQKDSRRRRGVLPIKKQPDPLARRIQGGIALYDLSRHLVSGVDTDIHFVQFATFTGVFVFDYSQPDASTYLALKDVIFPTPDDNIPALEETHKAMLKADAPDYEILIYSKSTGDPLYDSTDPDDSGKFTSTGVKLSDPSDIGAIQFRNGEDLVFDESSKFTDTLDMDADPVDFEFNGTEKVFFMPKLVFVGADASDFTFATADHQSQFWYLNYLFSVLPSADLALKRLGSATFGAPHEPANPTQDAQYQAVWAAIDVVKEYWSERAGHVQSILDEPLPDWSDIDPSAFGGSVFPNNSPTPWINEDLHEDGKSIESLFNFVFSSEPRLIAIILQGSNKFFMWKI